MSQEDKLQALFDKLKELADPRVFRAEEVQNMQVLRSTEGNLEARVREALAHGFKLNILVWVRRDGSANLTPRMGSGESILVVLVFPHADVIAS